MVMTAIKVMLVASLLLSALRGSDAFQSSPQGTVRATRLSPLFSNGIEGINKAKSPSDKPSGAAARVNKRTGYTTDLGYSPNLKKSPPLLGRTSEWFERRQQSRKDRMEDGYADMFDKKRGPLRTILKLPFKFAKRCIRKPKEVGTLILIRHGESLWNANQTFTGWADPDLSARGYREAEHAARLLLEGGYEIDVVFTSRLKRAIRTVWIILSELNEVYLPVFKSWRLQERHYGALTGLSKKQTAEQLGADLVQKWYVEANCHSTACMRERNRWFCESRLTRSFFLRRYILFPFYL
jgi:hypothetical protein